METELERRLIERARTGETSAWDMLYREYHAPLLHGVIRPRVASQADAEDVLGATFSAALRALERYEDTGRSLGAWLTRIAVNQCWDLGRRRSRAQRLEAAVSAVERTPLPLADASLVALGDRVATTARVHETLAGLNPRYATALRLRLLEDRPREDCARELEVSVATFDVVLLRAVRAFRAAWSSDESGGPA